MEALLKLSGVINEEDGDRADLQTLERRLVDKSRSQSKPDSPSKSPSGSTSQQSGPSVGLSPQADKIPIPISRGNSPDPTKQKEREEEVESLSDMMCSLVTNNCGETRYIGIGVVVLYLGVDVDKRQVHLPVSPSSHQRVSNGSTKRLETVLFKR